MTKKELIAKIDAEYKSEVKKVMNEAIHEALAKRPKFKVSKPVNILNKIKDELDIEL